MRRFPAINQLNPRRYGPIPIADQMLRMLRALLPGPVNRFGPEPKDPKAVPPTARITFNSVRPQRVCVHKPSSSSVPSGGNSGAVKGAFRSRRQTVLLTQPARFPARA